MSDQPDPELTRLREQKLKELQHTMATQSKTPTETVGKVLHLSTHDFNQTISEGVTLVDFYADWCSPCKMMAPIVDKLAQEYAGQAKVAKVDVDQNIQIAMRYQVQGVPTFAIFRDGVMVHRVVGGVGYQPLKTALDTFL
jgi:thioredoxin 1